MRRQAPLRASLCLFAIFAASAEDWPCFRGPSRQGISKEKNVPLRWSATDNVAWKTAIPGEGWSSPVVWRDRVFVTTATEGGQSCRVLALDRRSGRVVWNTEVFRQPVKQKEKKNSYASPTPVTDGRLVYAVFGGGGFAALDFKGKVVWKNLDYPHYSQHGLGASPVLHGDLLIMPRDWSSETDDKKVGWQKPWDRSFVVALDKRSGQERWKTGRGMSRIAHVTPNVLAFAGGSEIVSGAGDVVQGFEPASGKLLWTGRSQGEGVVPSIVIGRELIYTVSGFEKPTIRAFRRGGEVAWEQTKGVPMISSLLYAEPYVYSVTTNGIAHCFRADSGEMVWQSRVGGEFSASPVWAEGRIYLASEGGEVVVIESGGEFRELARNALGERIQASPAISRGQMFVRTSGHLYCVGKK